MHSHFPSSDIYKTFPYRSEVLKSLMCCDLISFHVFEATKCFYISAQRLIGATTVFKKGGFIACQTHGREVMLRVSHIAIDPQDILQSIAS
jgi:trehalose 6-phosphate synthase/phosphatase